MTIKEDSAHHSFFGDPVQIIVGVSASVAIYKAPVFIRRLIERGFLCRVVMSENATKLMSPQLFEAVSDHHVYVSEFGHQREKGMDHITLKNWADILIYYPASANLIGNIAYGHAPDLISTLYVAYSGPVFVAPAMNPDMLAHPMVRHNIRRLHRSGVEILDPTTGILACGEAGPGKLVEPEATADHLKRWVDVHRANIDARRRWH